VAGQARREEAGGLAKERAVLLLWFLRNVIGLDILDAYDFVTDGDDDHGVDGLYLVRETGDGEFERLMIFQSKYTQSAREIGAEDVKHLIATANHFRTAASLEALRATKIEPRLAGLIDELDLVRRLRDVESGAGRLELQLALVTSGFIGPGAQAEIDAANLAAGHELVKAWDIDLIGPIAEAIALRDLLPVTVTLAVPAADVLVLGDPGRRVAIAAVRADEIIKLPGIEDRSLFDLNVRRELGPNRVRRQLGRAIGAPTDHPDFLAFHNGLTVVCESFDLQGPGTLEINKISVVNGAQSVIAFHRDARSLTPELRIFVKLVEAANRPNLPGEVSRRSNTQNPVNPRMLMANSGPQLRLTHEFQVHFPEIEYITRPDATLVPGAGTRVIANDDAAQLLCAAFESMPWLAVKRTVLFESENHALIFKPSTSAAQVVLADEIGRAVDRAKDTVPVRYAESWQLTRIVAVYLAAQVLRAGEKEGFHRIISDPSSALDPLAPTIERLDEAVAFAAFTLSRRYDQLGDGDDYKKHFKNREVLRTLGSEARDFFTLQRTMPLVAAPGTANGPAAAH
jgi:hypothetical protein